MRKLRRQVITEVGLADAVDEWFFDAEGERVRRSAAFRAELVFYRDGVRLGSVKKLVSPETAPGDDLPVEEQYATSAEELAAYRAWLDRLAAENG